METTRFRGLLIAACLASCATKIPEAPPTRAPEPTAAPAMTTWRETVQAALAKAEAGNHDYILDHMLAPELVDGLVAKHGTQKWRRRFREGRLAQLSYHFSRLEGAEVETSGDRTVARGEHGCFAVFVEVEGRSLIADFGQEPSSM